MTNNYAHGRQTEWAIRADLERHGYEVIRAAGSKGPADLVAIKPGQVLLINVKRTRPPGPKERQALRALAKLIHPIGLPIVALKPPRHPPIYRHLTGPAPKHWEPWTPDLIT